MAPQAGRHCKRSSPPCPADIPVILEAKYGDFNESAEAQTTVAFDRLGTHAVTLNPYLGYDSLLPFLRNPQKGVFLMCKTTNPGTVDLQELPLAGEGEPLHLYEKMALLAQEWNTNANLGVVVSGLDAEALRRVRQLAPDLWIMAPGVGIPGKDLSIALQSGLRTDGLGLLIPVSRAIAHSANPRQAAQELHDAIQHCQRSLVDEVEVSAPETRYFPANLAEDLLRSGCVRFGQFTLKSGGPSPIYIDLRQLVSYPHVLNEVSAAYLPILNTLKFDRIAGLPYAALPIATTISLKTGWPVVFPRKEARSYGTRAEIEGRFKAGERVVVINDLATSGLSKFEAIDKLVTAGMVVEDVVVLIDRQAGTREALASGRDPAALRADPERPAGLLGAQRAHPGRPDYRRTQVYGRTDRLIGTHLPANSSGVLRRLARKNPTYLIRRVVFYISNIIRI